MDAAPDHETQLSEWVKVQLIEALDDENTYLHYNHRMNTESIHSWSQQPPAGQMQHPETTIQVAHPNLEAEITINGSPQFTTFDEDDDDGAIETALRIDANEADEHSCPECLREFDRDVWHYVDGWGDRSGSMSKYDCPEDDCDGRVEVYT